MKNNLSKSLLLFLAGLFLFLTVGAQFLHNHEDASCHGDCPACGWLIDAVFVLTFFLALSGFLRVISRIMVRKVSFFTAGLYRTSRHPRSPPPLV